MSDTLMGGIGGLIHHTDAAPAADPTPTGIVAEVESAAGAVGDFITGVGHAIVGALSADYPTEPDAQPTFVDDAEAVVSDAVDAVEDVFEPVHEVSVTTSVPGFPPLAPLDADIVAAVKVWVRKEIALAGSGVTEADRETQNP
jgi:hypothetical protein